MKDKGVPEKRKTHTYLWTIHIIFTDLGGTAKRREEATKRRKRCRNWMKTVKNRRKNKNQPDRKRKTGRLVGLLTKQQGFRKVKFVNKSLETPSHHSAASSWPRSRGGRQYRQVG